MKHTWFLQTLVTHFKVTKSTFRYNYGNMTKLDPSDKGHHIECQLKSFDNQNSTTVYIGPYDNLDDAQEDMKFINRKTD
jgi:hypothetical protein